MVNLEWANLEGAYLEGANLEGANLAGANLEGANLEGAEANERTTWTKGFDPKAAGVIFEDVKVNIVDAYHNEIAPNNLPPKPEPNPYAGFSIRELRRERRRLRRLRWLNPQRGEP